MRLYMYHSGMDNTHRFMEKLYYITYILYIFHWSPSDHCRSVVKYIYIFNSYWSIVDLQC